MTLECTVLILVVPLTVVIGAMVFHRATSLARIVAALTVGTTALVIVNQGRLGLIAWATQVWGIVPGYQVSHLLVGSLLAIAGFVGALVLAITILGPRPASAPGR
ncbi:hypothetical protein [Curtobacterium sp. L1-20]|uniref:hypothetical protein n=1 Tax=Curtobacterium sp. L1-20 TaxID=3138181 RepID=UPI003B528222